MAQLKFEIVKKDKGIYDIPRLLTRYVRGRKGGVFVMLEETEYSLFNATRISAVLMLDAKQKLFTYYTVYASAEGVQYSVILKRKLTTKTVKEVARRMLEAKNIADFYAIRDYVEYFTKP